MTELLAPAEIRSEPPPAPPTRKRWPRWLRITLFVLLGLIAMTMLAREFLVGSHRPFRWGSSFGPIEVEGVPAHDLSRTDTHGSFPEPMEIVQIPYADGKGVRIGFSIRNVGPWGVTLEHVALGPSAPEYATLLQPEGVLIGRRDGWTQTDRAVPFRPTYLRPDAERVLVLEYRFVCQRGGPGDLQGRDSVDVRFELFGKSQWQQLPLPFRVMLRYPPKGSCTPLH